MDEKLKTAIDAAYETWLSESQKIGSPPKFQPTDRGKWTQELLPLIRAKLQIYPLSAIIKTIKSEGQAQAALVRKAKENGNTAIPQLTFADLRDALTYRIRSVYVPKIQRHLEAPDSVRKKREAFEADWKGPSAEVWAKQIPNILAIYEKIGFCRVIANDEPEHWAWLRSKIDEKTVMKSVFDNWKNQMEILAHDARVALKLHKPDGTKRKPYAVEEEIAHALELNQMGNRRVPSIRELYTVAALKAYRDKFLTKIVIL